MEGFYFLFFGLQGLVISSLSLCPLTGTSPAAALPAPLATAPGATCAINSDVFLGLTDLT